MGRFQRVRIGPVFALEILLRWGFNRFGQLGLGSNNPTMAFAKNKNKNSTFTGHNNAEEDHTRGKQIKLCLEPRRIALFPGSVGSVDAAANSSAALRAEDGRLFTWGSNEAGRLGQHFNSHGIPLQHVHSPCGVPGLSGKIISSMTLTENGGFAFVPSSVSATEPPLVPIAGGTQIILRGGGFWDSADCVVKFIPLMEENDMETKTLPRSAVGKYLPPEASGPRGLTKPGVVCKLPRFALPGDVFAEVAMNGKDFTSDRVRVSLYEDPVITIIKPNCCSSTVAADLTIWGSGLFETGLIKVRLKERGGSGREWIVPGIFEQNASVCSDGDSTSPVQSAVLCTSPCVDGGDFPIEVRIAVALNGSDFVSLHGSTFVIHDAVISRLVPDCRPLSLYPHDDSLEGTKANRVVKIVGKSFFNSSEMRVTLSLEHNGSKVNYSCPAEYVDSTVLQFAPPSLYELLGYKARNASCEDGSSEEDGAPALPDQQVWTCLLELSLNGNEFLQSALPFMMYGQLGQDEIRICPPSCGPSSGGTETSLKLPSRFRCDDDDAALWPSLMSALVQFRPIDNKLMESVSVSARKELSSCPELDSSSSRKEWDTMIMFTTPKIKLEAILLENTCHDTKDGILDGGGSGSADGCFLNEEMDGLGGSASEYSVHAPEEPPRSLGLRQDMVVEVALDGENFCAACDMSFTYYGAPTVTQIKTNPESSEEVPAAAPGSEIFIFGTGFFEDGIVRVHLECANDKKAAAAQVTDASIDQGVIKFTMPELDNEADGGEKSRLEVGISFNGGKNFTSTCAYIDFIYQ